MNRWPRELYRYKQIITVSLSLLVIFASFHFTTTKAQADPISTTHNLELSMYDLQPSSDHVYDETDVISQWYRYLDTSGHREAEIYITSVFEEYGLNVTIQEYTAQRMDGEVRTANILGYLEGKNLNKCLVIGGHYDTHECKKN